MSARDAYLVARDFAPEPERIFEMPFHYLLYAEQGAMRLEADGKRWTLPPARAALITAGEPVRITLSQHVRACSVLFAPGFAPKPPSILSVFEMTSLARELLFALRDIGEGDVLDPYTEALFQALIAVVWRMSERPTLAVMPVPGTESLHRALAIMQTRLDTALRFDELAAEVAMSPRSLARRFMGEIGMTWREAQRRLRMIRAIEMMAESERGVADIALSVGYSSLSAFNAAFRNFAGQTPRQFRAGLGPARTATTWAEDDAERSE
ncbi:MAG: helix-turn-helix domain-containing protein [Pseudomonadota bacterium]